MRILVYGLGAALLGTVAFAQTSTGPSPGTETGTMRRPNAEAPGPASGSSDTSKGLSEFTGSSREQSGTRTRANGASSLDTSSTSRGLSERSVGARVNVGIGVERESGASVRRRTSVREYDDGPSVTTIHRRRSVTTYEEPDEISQTVIKKKKPSKRVAVVHTTKPKKRYVVRSGRVVEEPSVVIERRRTVRRSYETNEPGISVSNRTSYRRSPGVGVGVGVSMMQRRGVSVQERAGGNSEATTTRQRSTTTTSSPAETGALTTRRPGGSSEGGGSSVSGSAAEQPRASSGAGAPARQKLPIQGQ